MIVTTFNQRLEELAIEMKEIMFLKLSGEADVVLNDDARFKYLDSNNRNSSKVLTDTLLSSMQNVIAPLVLQQKRAFTITRSNIVRSLKTGFSKYRFYIDDVEVYTTGELVSYRGDYNTLGIVYSTNKKDLIELNSKSFPIEGGMFQSWKSGDVPIGKVSKFTLTESEDSTNDLSFDKVVYDIKRYEVRYYFVNSKD